MKRLLVFCLMILVTEVPAMFAGGPAEQSSKALAQQASLKEKAELFGPGTQVTARIRGTSSNVDYHGTIDEISGNNMKLKLKDRIMPIEFGQLEALHFRTNSYESKRRPDPVQARRVAIEIGIGEKAKGRRVSERFSGVIQSIGDESFTLNAEDRALSVRFDEVTKLEKDDMPRWAKGAIAGGVAFGLFALMMGIALSGD